jgi:sugar phosphate isomerase/epimerase
VAGAEYGFDLLLRETDPATVFFEADCGWMAAAGANPAEYLARFPGRFPMIHVKDFAPTHGPITDLFGSPRPQGVDLGRGFVDYKRIFAAARQTGLRHVFVEQEEPFAHSDMESARIDYEFLASFS